MNLSERTKIGMKSFVKKKISPLKNVVKESGDDFLNHLTPVERKVVELRLQDLTLQEIGDKIGISKQVANITEKRAIKRLERINYEKKLMW